jgi:3-phenylpropionate/trans-cinnamate dioxygenase ferredoxin reductase component
MSEHIVIIGNGVAGVTAARVIRKLSDRRITLISDESEYHFSRTALMYIYMGHMRFKDTKPYEDHFWRKNRIETIRGRVSGVDFDRKSLMLDSGQELTYDKLVIATGSVPRLGPWPGVELEGVHGLYHLQDLDRIEQATPEIRRAVIIGGGLIGVELCEMLRSRGIDVTFLVREAGYMDYIFPSEESAMIGREIQRHGVDLRHGTLVDEITGENGHVSGVRTVDGDSIPADFVGVAIGVQPNIGWLAGSRIEMERGILVDDRFQTSEPDVFAIGDCAEFREDGIGYTRIEQLWYTARRHGHALGRIICGGEGRYNRGIYFNSAKFFSLEYQQYGLVSPTPLSGEEHRLLHSDDECKTIRIAFDADSGSVRGFIGMGARMRQEVCNRWIRKGVHVDYVCENLREASFDPEFTTVIPSTYAT